MPFYVAYICLQPMELRWIDVENAAMQRRIAKAMERSHYPGPCEAKLIMNDLNRMRCRIYRCRIEVEHELFTVAAVYECQ